MTKSRTHYDNLKVARDAPDFVIRAAYKILSQKYHPDKNPDDARATHVMAIINQSYEVLSDPVRRKEHDDWIRRQELLQAAEALNPARDKPAPPQSPPIPPQWQQPEPTPPARTSRNWIAALLLSPFKLIAAVIEFSPRLAGSLLLLGGLWLWSALTPKKPPSPGPKPYQAEAPVRPAPAPLANGKCRVITYGGNGRDVPAKRVYSYVEDGVRNYSAEKPKMCDQDVVTVESDPSVAPVEAASTGYVRACRAIGDRKGVYKCELRDGSRFYSARDLTRHKDRANNTAAGADGSQARFHSATAPNGSPWPSRAGYVKGYPIENDGGYSEVAVDNSQNDADVFVKLVSLEGETAYPVRQFYIPARSKFTMKSVAAGKYDIRYRDLDTGGLSRSQSFEVTEERTADGVSYRNLTMTLYKVQGGNFQTYDLAPGEF